MADLDIVNQIKSCWSAKATGALFLKLSNDHLLQLFFMKGELQSIKYPGCAGIDAIKKIPGLKAVKSQFYEGAVSRKVHELPPTLEIINMINDIALNGSSVDTGVRCVVSAEQQTVIESIFTQYVGPIADLLFTEQLGNAKSVDDLVVRLSRQIDNVDDHDQFRDEVEEALQKLS